MANTISNTDNVIDSRDVTSRIEDLESEMQAAFDDVSQEKLEEVTEELTDKLDELNSSAEDAAGELDQPFVPVTLDEFIAEALTNSGSLEYDLAKEYERLSEGTQYDDLEHFIREVAEDEEHALYNEAVEYTALKDLADQGEGYGDWRHGETLIHEDYFVDYCQEMLIDCGSLPKDIPDYLVIDWDATADNLKVDYTEVDFDGETYFMRA